MKRLTHFLITMLLLSVPVLTYAQGFSIKAGSNLSSWYGDDVESSDVRLGYQVGIQYRIHVAERLHVVPGIQIVQRGTQDQEKETFEWQPDSEVSYEYSMKVRTNYLEFPVALEYQVDPSLYLIARPTLSFLLNNNYSLIQRQCVSGDCTGSKEEDEFDTFRDADFGLGLGLGYLINDHIALSAAYHWGLLTLDDEGDSEVYNRTIDISLEYRFQ